MGVETLERGKLDYKFYLNGAIEYLLGQVKENGYISASKDYDYYKPHWMRDSSFVALALLNAASCDMLDSLKRKEALEAAGKIISFDIRVIERYMVNIRYALSLKLEDYDFYTLKAHIPARVGENGEYFKGVIDGRQIDDSVNLGIKNAGLIQNDSIPLVLLAIAKKAELFGLESNEMSFLNENLETLLMYMGKTYITPSGSIWEIYSEYMHAYDAAAIYAAFSAARRLARRGIGKLSEERISEIENGSYKGGPLGFVKDFFISNGILYDTRMPFSDAPLTSLGVDSSTIFIFNRFGISGEMLGNGKIEKDTIREIEEKLFAGNTLPVRFLSDTYFKGGRWLLLGLEFSRYYSAHGKLDKGKEIIDYVLEKYGNSYPEQEIVNPATGIDWEGYLKRNGNNPIQNLAWSYASVIDAIIEFYRASKGQDEFISAKR